MSTWKKLLTSGNIVPGDLADQAASGKYLTVDSGAFSWETPPDNNDDVSVSEVNLRTTLATITEDVQIGDADDVTTSTQGDLRVKEDFILDKSLSIQTAASAIGSGNIGSTIAVNWGNAIKRRLQCDSGVGGATTVTFTDPRGSCNLILVVKQNDTGYTITWPANVKWAGGQAPTLSTATNSIDIVSFYYDSVDDVYYGQIAKNFS